MSTCYSISLEPVNSAESVTLEGGDVISAIPDKLIIFIGNTNILTVDGMFDNLEEKYWTAAAPGLTGTLLDEYGNVITTIAMQFTSASGNYVGSFGGLNFQPALGRGYTMLLQGVSDWGNAFQLPILTEVVNEAPAIGSG